MTNKAELLSCSSLFRPAPIILSDGEKGGVGKTFLARSIAYFLENSERPWRGLDLDPRNGNLERFHEIGAVTRYDWTDLEAWDSALREIMLLNPSTVCLIDLPAQCGSMWARQAPRFAATAAHLNRPLIRLWVMNSDYDPVNLLMNSLDTVPLKDTIAVLNLRHGPVSTFEIWRKSKTRLALLEGGGMELSLPELASGVAKQIQDSSLSFAAARSSVEMPFYRFDLESFFTQVQTEFAPLLERLK